MSEIQSKKVQDIKKSWRMFLYSSFYILSFLDKTRNLPMMLHKLGGLYIAEGEHAKAAKALERAIKVNPNTFFIIGNDLAIAYVKSEQHAKARDTFIRLLEEVGPENKNFWTYLAHSHSNLNNEKEAKEAYKRVTEIDPFDAIGFTHLGQSYFELDQYEKAKDALEKAIKLDPQLAHPYYALGQTYSLLTRYEEAIEKFQHYITLNPKESSAWDNIAECYLRLGQYDQADVTIKQALYLNPENSIGWYIKAALQSRNGEYEETIKSLKQTLKFNSKNFGAWRELGAAQAELKFYEDSKLSLERSLEGNPEDSKALHILGFVHYNLGQLDKSIQSYKRAIEISPDSNDILVTLGNLAYAQQKLGHYNDAHETIMEWQTRIQERATKHIQGTDIQSTLETKRAQPQISEGTIDLKLTQDSQGNYSIRILEFNHLQNSGLDGFQRLTGSDMRQSVIKPFHETLNQEWRSQNRIDETQCIIQTGKEIEPFQRLYQDFADPKSIQTDVNISHINLGVFKDYLAKKALTSEKIASYFPKTLILPVSKSSKETLTQRLESTFGNDPQTSIVIKPIDQAQGNGVEIHTLESAAGRLSDIMSFQTDRKENNFQADLQLEDVNYWDDPSTISGNILVQECVRSLPAKASDGNNYDGTMRVVFTVASDPNKKDMGMDIYFHGAYWKLPAIPYGADTEKTLQHDQIVSQIPSKLKADEYEQTLTAAEVSSPHRDIVYTKLREVLPQILSETTNPSNPNEFCNQLIGMLNSNDSTTQIIGINMATDFTSAAWIKLICTEDNVQRLTSRLHEMQQQESSNENRTLATDYLHRLMGGGKDNKQVKTVQQLYQVGVASSPLFKNAGLN